MGVAENMALLHRAAELFNKGRFNEYVDTLYHPRCHMYPLPLGFAQGREGIRAYYQSIFTAFPDANVKIEDEFGDGDKLAVRYTLRGTHLGRLNQFSPTKRAIDVPGLTILHFEKGQCVSRWEGLDYHGLYVQIGS